jgi:integrase
MMQTSAVRLSDELGYWTPGLGLIMMVAGLPPWPEPSSLSPRACPTSCEITVAMMLGHSRISVTMDTYSHVLPHLQEEAAAKMDALLAVAG